MNHVGRERVKSIIILILFVVSLVQVGILWGNQSHGLPFNFLSAFFQKQMPDVTDQMTRDDLFMPYRLVVSNGEEGHFILGRENPFYKPLWDRAKGYLSLIADGNLKLTADEKTDWGDVTTKRGILIAFNDTIMPSLLNWFIGKATDLSNTPSLTKMMLVPDNSDESSWTIYIYNPNVSVSVGKVAGGDKKQQSFEEILATIEKDESNTYREYISMRDTKTDKGSSSEENDKNLLNVEPDVLYLVKSSGFQSYNIVSGTIPASIGRQEELADTILGNGKERYKTTSFENGIIQMVNPNNSYKIMPNGQLEYEYLPEAGFTVAESGSDSAGEALLNSYRFIDRIEALTNPKAELQLSRIVELGNGSFTFCFDYFLNGMPIYVSSQFTESSNVYSHAIQITADSNRVLKCNWLIRDFTISGKDSYSDKFLDIADKIKNYKQLNIKIKDITVGYVMDPSGSKVMEPQMIIEKNDGTGILAINMPKRKGG